MHNIVILERNMHTCFSRFPTNYTCKMSISSGVGGRFGLHYRSRPSRKRRKGAGRWSRYSKATGREGTRLALRAAGLLSPPHIFLVNLLVHRSLEFLRHVAEGKWYPSTINNTQRAYNKYKAYIAHFHTTHIYHMYNINEAWNVLLHSSYSDNVTGRLNRRRSWNDYIYACEHSANMDHASCTMCV